MIEPLDDLPSGVLGFEAVGEVHSDDYVDVLVPAIDAAAREGPLRIVFVLGDRFEGYSAGAEWEDAKLGLHHLSAWERAAIVTDVEWVTHLVSLFGWMVPGRFRHFPLSARSVAVDWVAGDD